MYKLYKRMLCTNVYMWCPPMDWGNCWSRHSPQKKGLEVMHISVFTPCFASYYEHASGTSFVLYRFESFVFSSERHRAYAPQIPYSTHPECPPGALNVPLHTNATPYTLNDLPLPYPKGPHGPGHTLHTPTTPQPKGPPRGP